jgi:NTE family protein
MQAVYDNPRLAPLWPDRDSAINLNVNPVDVIICFRAGYGLRHDPSSQFLVPRLAGAFTCILDRAKNAAMNRLFEMRQSGKLRGLIIPYLGRDDSRMKRPPPDLLTRDGRVCLTHGLFHDDLRVGRPTKQAW